jgi:hypothetical protein
MGRRYRAVASAGARSGVLGLLADSMIPEAFEHERRSLAKGLLVTLGFSVAALLSANGG